MLLTDPNGTRLEGVHIDLSAADRSADRPRYLSPQHSTKLKILPMIALQATLRAAMRMRSELINRLRSNGCLVGARLAKKGRTNRTSALAIAALCSGGMVIARASERRVLANDYAKRDDSRSARCWMAIRTPSVLN